MPKATEHMIQLVGLQNSAELLIALGSRIPELMFPDWFTESRNMLAVMREAEAKLIEKLDEGDLRQFVYLSTRESPKTLQQAIKKAKKIISIPLKSKKQRVDYERVCKSR